MKKSPTKVKAKPGVDVKVKRKKTYTKKGSKFDSGGQTTKVYRKDGSLKRETNVNYSGKKKVPVTGGNPRFLSKTTVMVDEKVPASAKTTKFNRKGEVKKEISASNKKQTGLDKKKLTKISRQTRRDIKTADKKSPTTMKKSPSKMKSPAKKPLVGGQKRLPKELQEAILKAPAKMLTKSAIKMMDKSPAKGIKINPIEDERRKEKVKVGKRKNKKVIKESYSSRYGGDVKSKTKEVLDKKTGQSKTTKIVKRKKADGAKTKTVNKSISPMNMKTPMKKSKQKVEQDYARNAIADYKAGKKKEANYEKKKALEVAAGESVAKMKKPVKKSKITTASGSRIKAKLKKGTIKVKSKPSREAKKEGAKGRKFVVNTNQTTLNPEGGATLSDPNKYKSRRAAKKSPYLLKNPSKTAKKVAKASGLREQSKKLLKSAREIAGSEMVSENKKAKKLEMKSMRKHDKAQNLSRKYGYGSPASMKTNQSGGGYAAKNPAAPARQLKKLGSILSKHMKSN